MLAHRQRKQWNWTQYFVLNLCFVEPSGGGDREKKLSEQHLSELSEPIWTLKVQYSKLRIWWSDQDHRGFKGIRWDKRILCYWYIDTYFDTVKTKDQNWGKYAFYGVLFILCQDISRDPVHFDKFVDSIVNSRVKITHNDQGFTKRFFDEKKKQRN